MKKAHGEDYHGEAAPALAAAAPALEGLPFGPGPAASEAASEAGLWSLLLLLLLPRAWRWRALSARLCARSCLRRFDELLKPALQYVQRYGRSPV